MTQLAARSFATKLLSWIASFCCNFCSAVGMQCWNRPDQFLLHTQPHFELKTTFGNFQEKIGDQFFRRPESNSWTSRQAYGDTWQRSVPLLFHENTLSVKKDQGMYHGLLCLEQKHRSYQQEIKSSFEISTTIPGQLHSCLLWICSAQDQRGRTSDFCVGERGLFLWNRAAEKWDIAPINRHVFTRVT